MQKITKSIYVSLPIINIYVDEVREIYNFLAEHCKGGVGIEILDYKLDSIEEINNLPYEMVHNLEITCQEPYIRIRLEKHSASINASEDTIENEGIVAKLKEILLKHKLIVIPVIGYSFITGIAGGLTFFPIYMTMYAYYSKDYAHAILWFIAFTLLLTMTCNMWHQYYCRYSTIYLRARKEKDSFWKRNKDQLIMLLIGFLLGNIPAFGVYIIKQTDLKENEKASEISSSPTIIDESKTQIKVAE